jgi:hypothetical protein
MPAAVARALGEYLSGDAPRWDSARDRAAGGVPPPAPPALEETRETGTDPGLRLHGKQMVTLQALYPCGVQGSGQVVG